MRVDRRLAATIIVNQRRQNNVIYEGHVELFNPKLVQGVKLGVRIVGKRHLSKKYCVGLRKRELVCMVMIYGFIMRLWAPHFGERDELQCNLHSGRMGTL